MFVAEDEQQATSYTLGSYCSSVLINRTTQAIAYTITVNVFLAILQLH